jgi:simple sugar transport system permease protein
VNDERPPDSPDRPLDGPASPGSAPPGRIPSVARRLALYQRAGGIVVPLLTAVLAFVMGGIVVAISGHNPFTTYWGIFQGTGLDWLIPGLHGSDAATNFQQTLIVATPLMLTGLAVAFAFRCGMFNIGGQGQYFVGWYLAVIIGSSFTGLPGPLLIFLAMTAGALGGAAWAGIAGFLKASVGAHEVITTIMLNYIAGLFLTWLILQNAIQDPDRSDAISTPVDSSAQLPALGGTLRVHLGIVLAVLATAGVAWLLNRSSFGFELRAVGANPYAARTAGISVGATYVLLMAAAGALSGLGGAVQVLGVAHTLTPAVAGNIGFDGLLVALLGRTRPWGVLLAALLFGALYAGGNRMQSYSGISLELVTVLQALIVVFIAAPALVKAIFRLRDARAARFGASMAKGW